MLKRFSFVHFVSAAMLALLGACESDDDSADPSAEADNGEDEDPARGAEESAEPAEASAPEFAQEGRIYFNSSRDRGSARRSAVFAVEPGGSATSLTDELDLRRPHQSPAPSPDGERIAFSAPYRADRFGGHNDADILTIDVDGGDLENLTDAPDTRLLEPAWSPDGDEIAYSDGEAIYVLSTDGSDAEPENLTGALPDEAWEEADLDPEDGLGSPAWSPDGERVAFGVQEGTPVELAAVDRDDPETIERLTKDLGHQDTFEGQVRNGHAAYGPDGAKLAFSADDARRGDIYLLDLESGDLTNVTDSDHVDLGPTWSPNGEKLAFYSDREAEDNGYDIFVMNRDGENLQNVTQLPESSDRFPAWSP